MEEITPRQKVKNAITFLVATFGPAILYAIGEVAIRLIEEKIIHPQNEKKESKGTQEE
jgi:hypothetical protein